jgi:regulator of ribonuclease activity A
MIDLEGEGVDWFALTTTTRSGNRTMSSSRTPNLLKSTPDLCDEYEETIRVLDPIFTNYGGPSRFAGTVVTVKCYEDNSVIKQLATEMDGTGRVMVVDGGGSRRRALLGDMVAADLVKQLWAGIVIYGSIRDVDEIRALETLGVQALGTHPMKTQKRNEGQVNIPVTFAGVTIYPGDYIACDNNGIVVNATPMNGTAPVDEA